MQSETSSQSSSDTEVNDFVPQILAAKSLDGLLALIDETFAYPKPYLKFESDRMAAVEAIAKRTNQMNFDLEELIEFFVTKKLRSKNTGILKTLFTTSVVRENQELARATANIALGELARLLDENTLLIRLKIIFWRPLLQAVKTEKESEPLMGAVRSLTVISELIEDARNISVDPSVGPLRDEIILALLELVPVDDEIKFQYSVAKILRCISGLLGIKRLALDIHVFSQTLQVSLLLASGTKKKKRTQAAGRVLKVLTKLHAQTWLAIVKILHAVTTAKIKGVEIFNSVCGALPELNLKEFHEYADCVALALSLGHSGAPSVRKLLNAGKFRTLNDGINAMPVDVVGQFVEFLIERDVEARFVLMVLKERAKDLPSYFTVKLINLIFTKNKRYFDCIQYVAEIHLETSIRKLLERCESTKELDYIEPLLKDKQTVLRGVRVTSDLLCNTDARDCKSYEKIAGAFVEFTTSRLVRNEVHANFKSIMTAYSICILQSPETLIEGLLELCPTDHMRRRFQAAIEKYKKADMDEVVYDLALEFPDYVDEGFAEPFLTGRSREANGLQRVAASALLSAKLSSPLWSAESLTRVRKLFDRLILEDTEHRVRKFAARSVLDKALVIQCIQTDANVDSVVKEALQNARSRQDHLSIKLSDISARLISILASFNSESSRDTITKALDLIEYVDFEKEDVQTEITVLVLLHQHKKAIETICRVLLKQDSRENLEKAVCAINNDQESALETLISILVDLKVLDSRHLVYAKSLGPKLTTSQCDAVIGNWAVITSYLVRLVDKELVDKRKIVSVLIGFASQSELDIQVRARVVLSLRAWVTVGRPWTAN